MQVNYKHANLKPSIYLSCTFFFLTSLFHHLPYILTYYFPLLYYSSIILSFSPNFFLYISPLPSFLLSPLFPSSHPLLSSPPTPILLSYHPSSPSAVHQADRGGLSPPHYLCQSHILQHGGLADSEPGALCMHAPTRPCRGLLKHWAVLEDVFSVCKGLPSIC